jgi:type I restriction enzyme, S subunit
MRKKRASEVRGQRSETEKEAVELPKGWVSVNFFEFCRLQRGYDLPLKTISIGDYPVVTSSGVHGYHNEFRADGPCLITGRSGGVGNVHYLDVEKYWPHNTVLFVKDFCGNNPKYVYYYFLQFGFTGFSASTTIPTLDRKQLYNEVVYLPPLAEQHRIVAKIEELFSSLDKGIEDLKTAQQQLKVYRQAVLKWAFEGKLTNENVVEGELPREWRVVRIGDIAKCIVPNRDKPKSFSGDIKWVTTPDLHTSSIRLDYDTIQMGLTREETVKYNARVIPVGSVIMTCVGTFGLSVIVEKPIVINQQLHAFLGNDKIDARYLAYCIRSNKGFFEKKSTSTTIQYLNKENCNSMPFPLCSLPEQQLIVSEIESRLSVCDKIEETIERSLKQAESLRQSILKKAFEGRLVPQDQNDEPASVLLARIKAERDETRADAPRHRRERASI